MRRLAATAAFLLLFSVGALSAQQPTQTNSQPPGQVTGHVINANNGAPIADAIVVLCSNDLTLQTQHSGTDGGFTIAGVPPGKYLFLRVYATGFAPLQYQPTAGISVTPGRAIDIDLRVIAGPVIEPMSGDEVLPRSGFTFKFSPTGMFVAFAPRELPRVPRGQQPKEVNAWLYDRSSKQLLSVPLNIQGFALAPGPPAGGFVFDWPDDDTLYISCRFLGNPCPYFRVSGIRASLAKNSPSLSAERVQNIPDAVMTALNSDRNYPLEAGIEGAEYDAGRYTVAVLRRQVRGGPTPLVMESKDGTVLYRIEENFVGRLLVDKDRSLLFYGRRWGSPDPAITTFDLDKRSARETLLPDPLSLSPDLGDQIKDGTGTILVYRVNGPCIPSNESFEAEIEYQQANAEWNRGNAGNPGSFASPPRDPFSAPFAVYHICFVKVP